jgi:quinol monooxygenase YgiN
MRLFVFIRFHAREGQEDAVAAAIHEVVVASRAEAGCVAIEAFRAIDSSRLFYIHSRWTSEAAFDDHAGFPHTVQFLEQVRRLVDHPLEVVRTKPLG